MKKGAYLLTGVIPLGLASLGLCGTAFGAQSDASSMSSGSVPTEAQLQQMNERIQQLEANQKQMQAEVAKARAEKKKAEKKKGSDWVMKGHGGRLKFETRDGRNSIALEGRLQEDSTMSWNGGPAFNKGLAGNTAFRRARIRVVGKIDTYWDYALQYDFTHGHIEDAYLGYTGFGFNLFGKRAHSEIIAGNQFVGFGFHVSSKYGNFLENPTPADTFRPGRELGISYRAWQKHWNFWTTFTDGYGPGGVNDVGKGGTSQYTISGRLAINFINTPNRVVQLGNSVAYEGILNKNDITYNRWRERPGSSRGFGERLIDTGKLGDNIDHVLIYSPNVTIKQGPLDVVGAYYVNKVARNNGESSPTFTGWDVQAGYFLTPGDSRPFSSSHAAFGRVHPQHPLNDGGIGAWQIAARGEQVNLNDGGVNGGKMTDAVAALNWWPENNIRFQLQYIDTLAVHGGPHAGTKPQIMAMRMQYDF